ncbi:MAG: hypothetical protein HQL30_03850 [Candidatus Omnitrophica bacterium]|nr:hypothetical protein [Candidatus Omnitrophota bacterium]
MDDIFSEFLECEFIVGSDMKKGPACGASDPCSLIFDDELECQKCAERFRK